MCYFAEWYYGPNIAESWYLSSSSTLLFVLCKKASNLLKVRQEWHHSASTLIWYHKHRQTHTRHTRTNTLTYIYKYMLTPPVTCIQQLPILHWMNNNVKTEWKTEVHNVFAFQKLLNCRTIYLLIRFKKTMSFLWNTYITHREKVTLERVS